MVKFPEVRFEWSVFAVFDDRVPSGVSLMVLLNDPTGEIPTPKKSCGLPGGVGVFLWHFKNYWNHRDKEQKKGCLSGVAGSPFRATDRSHGLRAIMPVEKAN